MQAAARKVHALHLFPAQRLPCNCALIAVQPAWAQLLPDRSCGSRCCSFWHRHLALELGPPHLRNLPLEASLCKHGGDGLEEAAPHQGEGGSADFGDALVRGRLAHRLR